jgi:hypothetical protein
VDHRASRPCGLPERLATLTRNQVRYTGTQVTIPTLTEATSTQRQAFELIGTAIPLPLEVPEHYGLARKTPGQAQNSYAGFTITSSSKVSYAPIS